MHRVNYTECTAFTSPISHTALKLLPLHSRHLSWISRCRGAEMTQNHCIPVVSHRLSFIRRVLIAHQMSLRPWGKLRVQSKGPPEDTRKQVRILCRIVRGYLTLGCRLKKERRAQFAFGSRISGTTGNPKRARGLR